MAIKEQKNIENVEEELNKKLEEIGLSINLVDDEDVDDIEEEDDEEIDPKDIHFKVLGDPVPVVEDEEEDNEDEDE
jgi:hypothetical protein